jgi:hypothetical protein
MKQGRAYQSADWKRIEFDRLFWRTFWRAGIACCHRSGGISHQEAADFLNLIKRQERGYVSCRFAPIELPDRQGVMVF